MNKLLIIFLSVLGLVYPAYAQQDFQLIYTGEKVSSSEEEILRKGANYIVDFYKSIDFPININNINFRVFASSSDYADYQRRNSDTDSTNGYYSHKKKEIVICRNESFIKTFFHEFNHYLLRSYFVNPPKWINEGLSEYFEYLDVRFKNTAVVLPQRQKLGRIKLWLNRDIGNDIDWVLSCSRKEWIAQSDGPKFRSSTLSYGIVFFLMSQEHGDQTIGKILKELMAGRTSKEAINLSYSGGLEKFKSDFTQFYSNLK